MISDLVRNTPRLFQQSPVDWEDDIIVIYFYNDGEISEELDNDYRCVGTEVIANYTDARIAEKIIRLDYPERLPHHEHWVYKRRE